MNIRIAVAAMIGIGALTPQQTQAWWDLGHSALCDVALQQVSASTRQQIEALIEEAQPVHSQYKTFGSQCVWADDIKSAQRQTGPWHYLNMPPDENDVTSVTRPDNGDILSALEQYLPILSDASLPAVDRLEALRFVGHFVGDLHQPMHLAYEEDWGGNRYRLSLSSDMKTLLHEDRRDTTNMHAVWDGYLTIYAADRAGKGLMPLIADETAMATGNYLDWAAESLAIVRSEAVQYATEDRLGALTEDYLEANADTAVKRLRQAAARLAKVLDEAFSTQ
jgi:hypothetical protein